MTNVDPNESATDIVPQLDDDMDDTEGHRYHRYSGTGGADEAGDTEGHLNV